MTSLKLYLTKVKARLFQALVLICAGGVISACSDPEVLINDRVGLPAARGVSNVEGIDGLTVGHTLMEADEYELALKAYTRAAVDLGLNADVLSAMGSANLKLGRLNQAEKILKHAIEKDGKFVPAINNLGVVLFERREYAQAREQFRVAYALDSGNSDDIRDNLRRSDALMQNIGVVLPEDTSFRLVRRGNGRYLLLGK